MGYQEIPILIKDGAKNYTRTGDLEGLVSLKRLLPKKNTKFPEYKKRYNTLYVIWCMENDITSYYVASLLSKHNNT